MHCPRKDCDHRGIDLPESEFQDRGRLYKQCGSCRERQRHWKEGKGLNSRGFKLHHTAPGAQPQFVGEWDKRMWSEWLKGLVGQVEHS